MTVKFEGFCSGVLRGVWIALLLVMVPAMAGRQTVTTTNDSLAGSFRYAVTQAAPGDTVCFNVPAVDSQIGPSTQIVIDKDIVVLGRNSSNNKRMTINSRWGVFAIRAGKVCISNLSLWNSFGSINKGGVVFISGENTEVRMDSMEIMGGDITGFGGGIYDSFANVKLNACTIHYNGRSPDCCTGLGRGGGIYNYCGNFIITNSIITRNTAGGGGGIYNAYGTMTISNSTISNNTAYIGGSNFGSTYGGGIANYLGNLVIFNSTITNNTCTSYPTWTLVYASAKAFGGGVCNLLGLLAIVNSTVCYNTCFGSCGLNSCYGISRGGGLYTGNGGCIDDREAIGCLINTTIFGDTCRNQDGLCYSGGLSVSDRSYGINNIMINNSGGDGIAQAGCKNLTGDILSVDTLVGRFYLTKKEVFGKDTVASENNGGPTKTIALYPDAMAIGAGVRCGYFYFDTLIDTTFYKKEVTNIKPAYYNGTDWICVATTVPVLEGTQITEITTDQRGFVRPNPPCIGAYEYGEMPIAVKNGKKIISGHSGIKCMDFHGDHLTAWFPVAGNYTIKLFNSMGRMVDVLSINRSAGLWEIGLSHSHARGLYVVSVTGGNLRTIARVFAR